MGKGVDLYLSIGTNQGDRESNVGTALSLLEEGLGVPPVAVSSIVETRSWGFEGADFLNCAVLFDTDMPPADILVLCKSIEGRMGRVEKIEYGPDGRRVYHDRIVDIDILLYGNETVDLPDLKIPHPLMTRREFVMEPLMEIYAPRSEENPNSFLTLQFADSR